MGTVTDLQGVVVPHAKITAVNIDTGAQLTTESQSSGVYILNPLQPGNYKIEAVAKGFSTLIQENVSVDNSAMFGLNMKLTPGDESKTITITTDAPPFLDTLEGGTRIENNVFTVRSPSSSVSNTASAAVPLFRDPIHDGAADPVVVWNRARKRWWMFYTNRRADLADSNGVTWVHGTRIGIAESSDGGASWKYVSEANIPVPSPDYTLWAPEIIDTGGTYHMFLTVVPGTFTDWNHPRHILHLTSQDLVHWKPLANANLESDRTIDACIFRLPSGLWRLWYKNEADSSKVYFSDSPDLVHWTHRGIATTNHREGPVVFQWRGSYWLINDPHTGLAVFRSTDLTTWHQQPRNLLREPGTQPTDRAMGNHADVVVDGSGRAWLFYFTQQGGVDAQGRDPGWARRSVLHVTELHEANGILTVDRNAPATIHMLPPPINKKSDMAGAWTLDDKDGAKVDEGARPSSDSPVRVASGTMAARLIHQINPVYPRIVDEVRGAVVMLATISIDGNVARLIPISGPPMLYKATTDAVKQWKYKPYVQDGQPVDVDTTITINVDYGGNVIPDKPKHQP